MVFRCQQARYLIPSLWFAMLDIAILRSHATPVPLMARAVPRARALVVRRDTTYRLKKPVNGKYPKSTPVKGFYVSMKDEWFS